MNESKASRTLVKSPPELWSEISNPTALQRHMDHFGEIRITRLEPETAVAWEGEQARGTITLETSGWGTKVSLTAEPLGTDEANPEGTAKTSPGAANESERHAVAEPEPAAEASPEPAAESEPGAAAEPEPAGGDHVEPDPPRLPDTAAEPPDQAAEVHQTSEPTVSLEHDKPGPEMRKDRWTRRLARRLRAWFRPAPPADVGPAQDTPRSEPDDPAGMPEPVISRPEQPASGYAPVPGPEPPPEPQASADTAAPAEAQPKPAIPPTDALVATLDSLGQAHHRPFSRA